MEISSVLLHTDVQQGVVFLKGARDCPLILWGGHSMVKRFRMENGDLKLSEHFKIREFRCKCGKCNELLLDETLVDWLQRIRNHFGVSVHINSGYRCQTHNKAVGGSSTSHHMRGMAADIRVKGVSPKTVAQYAETIGILRIGLYEGVQEGEFVHIGSDTRKRFWLGHAGISVDTFADKQENTFALTLPVLKRGRKGEEVKALQAHLVGYGYDLAVDGSFGSATEAAVKAYQKEQGLTVDGSVGPQTRKQMLGLP